MKFIVGFGRFWWDFIVGEDWKIAAGVAAVLAAGAVLVAETKLSDTAISLLAGLGILLVVTMSIIGGAVGAARHR
ncbi:MAG TPA: hypothetical protein VGL76_09425 [Gaiellaceae bacterium]